MHVKLWWTSHLCCFYCQLSSQKFHWLAEEECRFYSARSYKELRKTMQSLLFWVSKYADTSSKKIFFFFKAKKFCMTSRLILACFTYKAQKARESLWKERWEKDPTVLCGFSFPFLWGEGATQYSSYSAEHTFEGVNYTENNTFVWIWNVDMLVWMWMFGKNVNRTPLTEFFYDKRMSPVPC